MVRRRTPICTTQAIRMRTESGRETERGGCGLLVHQSRWEAACQNARRPADRVRVGYRLFLTVDRRGAFDAHGRAAATWPHRGHRVLALSHAPHAACARGPLFRLGLEPDLPQPAARCSAGL